MEHWTGQCVIVDHLDVGHSFVALDDVAKLGIRIGAQRRVFFRLLSARYVRNRTGAVGGSSKQDIMTSLGQSACQAIDDGLRPAVAGGWDWYPGWSNDSNAHG